MKKIVAVNAGPRKGWNTDLLIQEAVKGAQSKGAEVEVIDLFQLERYTGCVSCFGCKQKETLGKCIHQDGLTETLEKIRNADGLIIGSPIYLMDVTASFRALLERLIFPNVTYKKEIRSYNTHPIPVLLILTSNIPTEGLADLSSRYQGMLEGIGPTKVLSVGSTLQINNYEDYDWTMFDAQERRKRREEIFPQELAQAFQLGAEMVGME